MSNPSLVSVLMPVYNSKPFLAEAIESILSQTFTDFEFLIIDDGSTDGSRAIIESYAQKDQRIQFISRENRGIVTTRNELIERASGTYCAWLDHDDAALPERLSRQVEYMTQHPECVILGSRILLTDQEGESLCELVDEYTHEEIERFHIDGIVVLFQTSTMMRLDVLRSIGGYRRDYELAEDYDVYLRMAECGRLANLPTVLTKHRQHFASAGHSSTERQLLAADAAVNAARTRRGMPPFKRENTGMKYRPTMAEQCLKWSWWALSTGNVRTARKYAFAALQRQPLVLESWKAVYCCLRGY